MIRLNLWRITAAIAGLTIAGAILLHRDTRGGKVAQVPESVSASVLSPPAPAPAPLAHKSAVTARVAKPAREEESGPGGDGFLYKIRAFPHRRIPPQARRLAFEQARKLAAPRAVNDSSNQWTLVGPQPTAQGYSGRVTALAIDPRSNDTVYLGGAEGGIWKTTNGGASWTPLTDFEAALAIGSIVIDPTNPDIVYAGTGEDNSNQDAYVGMGILKSSDAGATWTLLDSTYFDQRHVGSLAVCPNNGQVILAGAPSGLFRSADGGQTWTSVMQDETTSIVFDPTNGNIAYAALIATNDPTGIYKSVDAGQTWTIANGAGTSAIDFSSSAARITLAISPLSTATLYAGVYNDTTTSTTPLAALYRTTNGAQGWSQIAGQAYCETQCWYNNTLAVSPADPNLLLGGGVGLYQSSNGGTTWVNAVGTARFHPDQHAIAFTPDGSRVYVGNDGGAWLASVDKTALSWSDLNSNLALTQFYPGLSLAPGNPSISFGGTQDQGSLGLAGGQWASIGCGDGAATAVDPTNSQNVYAACAGVIDGEVVILRSTSGGAPGTYTETFAHPPDGSPFVPYMVVDPSQPAYLYLTGNKYIYQSHNYGSTFQAISPDVTADVLWPCAIAVAPSDSNTVYSGSCDGVAMVTHNALMRSSATWQDISSGLGGAAITHMTVDPKSALTVYATLSGFQSGHVFESQNGGQTWTDITGNLPDISANDLTIDPDVPNTLYVATDMGVFWTNNGGQLWSALGQNLPTAAVLSLAFDEPTRTLRAATHGRAVWDLLLPTQGLHLIPSITGGTSTDISVNASNPLIAVQGANFTSGSQALWNGQPRTTAFSSSTELMVTPDAGDLSADNLALLTVYTPGPGGGMSNPLPIKVGPNPAIIPGGFGNAASFKAGVGVAPGSLVSVFGINLASGVAGASKIPLPASLAGGELQIADPTASFTGKAPLLYASGGQMNIQIPWEVAEWDTVNFTPTLNGVAGAPLGVAIQPFAPGIFTVNAEGTGQGLVTNALTNQLAAPSGNSNYPNSAPVKRGGYLAIYCTGLGAVDTPPKDGAAAPSNPPANTLIFPEVLIGAAQGNVIFSGLAPGFVGLYQVNVQVPMTAPSGNAVPISISDGYGGDVSNVVTVAID